MVASATREVLFRFKGEVDPSIKRSLVEVANLAKKTEQAKVRSVVESTKVQRDASREEERAARDYVRHETMRIRAVEKRTREESRLAQRALQERAKEERAFDASLTRAHAQWQNRQRQEQGVARQAALERQKADAIAYNAAQQTAKGLIQAGSSALNLVKVFAMLSAMGEKDLEKLVRRLSQIQIYFEGMRSAYGLVMGLRKAYQAYAAAIAAAAAAQVALNVAQGVSPKGGPGKAPGGAPIIPPIGPTASAASLATRALPPLLKASGLATLILVAGTALAAAVSKTVRDVGYKLIIGIPREERKRAKLAKTEWERGSAAADRMGPRQDLYNRLRPYLSWTPQQELQEAQASRPHYGKYLMGTTEGTAPSNVDYYQARLNATAKELSARERILDSIQDSYDTSRREMETRVRGAQDELKTQREKIKVLREQTMTAQEKFGQLGRGEQREVVAAVSALRSRGWDALSRRQKEVISSVGLASTTEAAKAGFRADALRADWASVARPDWAKQSAMERSSREFATRKEFEFKGKYDINVKLDTDPDIVVKEIERQLLPKMERDRESQKQAIRELIIDAFRTEQQLNKVKTAAASRG